MAKKSIHVIGIMIGDKHKDFKLYAMSETSEKRSQAGTYFESGSSESSFVEGLGDIARYLANELPANTQFVVVYDVSCPNKEMHLKKILEVINKLNTIGKLNTINKNDLLPTLVSIGHEQSQFNGEITNLVSNIEEVQNTDSHNDLFKTIIQDAFNNTKRQLLAAENTEALIEDSNAPRTETTSTSSEMDINMMVLGGFIATAGIAAVALAFTVLNAATFGAVGLVVAIVGAAATLSGVGLFATGTYKNKQTIPDDSLHFSENVVYQ